MSELTQREKFLTLQNTVRVIRGSGARLTREQEQQVKKIEALVKRLEARPTL
jgi:hypothetical protein